MTMPKKERAEEVLHMSQKRPAMERYRLQVDRQTKVSFPTIAPAEKAGVAGAEGRRAVPLGGQVVSEYYSVSERCLIRS